MLAHFVVSDAPRTKKNSNVLARAGRRSVILPSKSWRTWSMLARIEGHRPQRIRDVVNCKAYFYRDANRGDAVGYYQGLADLLELRDVLENDKQIVSWDGSRLRIDRDNPRTEVWLERAG